MGWLVAAALVTVCPVKRVRGLDLPAGSSGERQTDSLGLLSEQAVLVPVTLSDGRGALLHGRLCWLGTGQKQLVLINHGTPISPEQRSTMRLGGCTTEASLWFLRHGYAVAFVLRRGYGETGGRDEENSISCVHADYVRSGIETAVDIDATIQFLTTNFRMLVPNNAIVVGQSSGGWGSIAYNSTAHPRVGAFINMAGGRGGHYRNFPGSNCQVDLLIRASAHFGQTATTRMLWIYAKNDSFFGPQLANQLWQAFVRTGGSADLEHVDSFGNDGHELFFGRGGSEIWGPIVESYLKQQFSTQPNLE